MLNEKQQKMPIFGLTRLESIEPRSIALKAIIVTILINIISIQKKIFL